MVEYKEVCLSSPVRTRKLQLAAKQPLTGKFWILFLDPTKKKDIPHPRIKKKPQQDGRIGKIVFRIKTPYLPEMLRGPRQNLLHTRTQRPHRDWSAQPLAEEALPIAEKRRETKGKGEKERYIHLNAEFQRIERRDKKPFLSNQCKEIEENNRMGKTRDLFKKLEIPRECFMQRWAQ